jgi:thiol-disulfide isomerase/thioredoxin
MAIKTIAIAILLSLITLISNGQQVKNFRLNDLDNTSRSFAELKGEKITIIDFWATWCKPCNKAIPELNKIYDSYKDKGVQIIGINCDGPRSINKVAPLASALKIKYQVLTDIDSEVMKDLNINAFPTLIIINSQGKIVWIHEGFSSGDEKIIIKEIEKNLSKS